MTGTSGLEPGSIHSRYTDTFVTEDTVNVIRQEIVRPG